MKDIIEISKYVITAENIDDINNVPTMSCRDFMYVVTGLEFETKLWSDYYRFMDEHCPELWDYDLAEVNDTFDEAEVNDTFDEAEDGINLIKVIGVDADGNEVIRICEYNGHVTPTTELNENCTGGVYFDKHS